MSSTGRSRSLRSADLLSQLQRRPVLLGQDSNLVGGLDGEAINFNALPRKLLQEFEIAQVADDAESEEFRQVDLAQ
jgi:hypothetical protein